LVSRLGKFNNYKIDVEKQSNEVFFICSCSALTNIKRVERIINVISEIKGFKINWVHFGSGPNEVELLKYAKEKLSSHTFEFKGNTKNKHILEFYANNFIDLFINLSDSEGIPVSIMEAQSFGIPVLATNVGGTNEIVNDLNGFLINPAISDIEIAEIIKLNFNKDLTNKRIESRNNWNKNYNAENNYINFCSIIKELR
jgi:glycosyltransferase involved in cell wall biosynthesis